MLINYIREYIAIVRYLLKQQPCRPKGNFICVKKEELIQLLNRNQFDTPANKLKIWKELQWLDAADGRITKQIRQPDTGERTYVIQVRYTPAQIMENVL